MTDVATDLLGEIVHVCASGSDFRELGIVRGVAKDDRGMMFIVEMLEYQNVGEIRTFSTAYSNIRPVKRCARCWAWDHHSQMIRAGLAPDPIGSLERADVSGWEHREGKGCLKK